ncbi:hypothetical protein AB4Z39_18455 [Mycobacterium adipatum]|uniref:hypothetical protein n=1 Tax=Mycobacterium adipatum TaxID=1682113 RepID=UPI0034E0C4C4
MTRQLDQDTGPVNGSPKRTLFAGSQAAFGADGSLAPLAQGTLFAGSLAAFGADGSLAPLAQGALRSAMLSTTCAAAAALSATVTIVARTAGATLQEV